MRYLLLAFFLTACAAPATAPLAPPAPAETTLSILQGLGLEDDGVPTPDEHPIPPWFTEETTLFERGPTGAWLATSITVRSISNEKPRVCFRAGDERLVECFYVDNENQALVDLEWTWALGNERIKFDY